jgi:hypothetical protein
MYDGKLFLKIFQGIVRPNSRDATEGFTQHGEDGRAGKSFYSRKKWMDFERKSMDEKNNDVQSVYLPNRLSSLEVLAKIFRMRRKYHIKGGTITNVTGKTTTVETKAPKTRNEITRKSKSVAGS